MNISLNGSAVCFGKVPSRGDFVKSPGQHQLISVLDRWVSQAMALLSEDPRWKAAYDHACALDFAFVGARSRLSVVGHMRPSTDASGRRFPFLAAQAVERDDALMFRCAPAGMGGAFTALGQLVEAGFRGDDVADLLVRLEGVDCANSFEVSINNDPLGNFVRGNTLLSFSEMLGVPLESVRRIILAIGLLLRQVLGQATADIGKDLVFPLPVDERNRHLAAGLWLYLVSAFLRKSAVEMAIVIDRRTPAPRLLLGFKGSSPEILVAAIYPESALERCVSLVDPEWIEGQPALTTDYGVAKLSSYLAQPDTTLEQAVSTFRNVFLGE